VPIFFCQKITKQTVIREKLCKALFYKIDEHEMLTPGVNFINVLLAAFTHTDLKSAKKTVKLSVSFMLLESVPTKAARRMLMKLIPYVVAVVW